MTQEQLVLPADYPIAQLRNRAIEHLNENLDKAVLAKTGRPIRLAGVLIGLLILVAYFDTVVGGFFSGLGRVFLTSSQLIMGGAILGCLGWACLHGRRLQKDFSRRCQAIQDQSLCPLTVLNARLEDIQTDCSPAVEPKEILARQRMANQRALQTARPANASAASAPHELLAPQALSETVAQSSPRPAISL